MTVKTIRLILETIAAITLWISSYDVDNNIQPELRGMSIGLGIAVTMEIIIWLILERKFLGLYASCFNPFLSRREIRLTIAYLYRIEVKGKYLLVKSNRLPNLYQPVGGVYKYFHPEATKDLQRLGVITDCNIQPDDDSEHDLRVKLNDRRKLFAFLKWFHKNEEREIDPWREFYEELVAPQILPKDEFGFIYYDLIGSHCEPIHFDQHFRIDTFKYADIYSPRFATSKQHCLVDQLVNKHSDQFIWATEAEIMAGRTVSGNQIAEPSKKIFHTKKDFK